MELSQDEIEGFRECVDVNTAGMVRVSFGIYNTPDEVDEFLQVLPKALEMARTDMEGYSRAKPRY